MWSPTTKIASIVLGVMAILLAGCQAIQPSGSNPLSEAWVEQMKAEAAQQELLTFDLMIKQDWSAYDAATAPNFYQSFVTSLWVKQQGKWQNRFLVDQERKAAFTVVGN